MRRSPPGAWSRSSRSPATTSSSLPLQSLAPKEHGPMPSLLTSTPFLVAAAVIVLVLLIAFVASRYHVAGANEALIVAGSRGAKVRDERGQVVASLTIEELIRDRQKLLQQVQDAAKGDLATSGLQIDAFTIQSFSDESNYIELLGQQSVATVSRDARMAKASTDQEAAVREAEAQQIKINAARDVSLREAETRTQVQAAQARADQAGPLAQAEATQEVVRKQTELAQLEADRKEKELLSTTVKPAAADAQAVIARAEGAERSDQR